MAKKRLPKKRAGKSPKPKARKSSSGSSKRRKLLVRSLSAKKKKKAKPTKKTSVKKKKPTPRVSSRKSKRSGESLEAKIKKIDFELLSLINQRAMLTTKMLESHPNPQEAMFDPRSNDELWDRLHSSNSGPLSMCAVRGVFREILSEARQRVKTQRVVYLGPPFSFTHLAAIERFGKGADLVPVNTIASVFEEVNRGHANYGLVPIENSTDGRVIDTLAMFQRLPLRICGESQIHIHHNLLARCPRSEISEIYSKPQALSQCRDWLARNMPQSRLIEVTSTSTASQLARDKSGVAAVASRQAAVEYDLQIVADNIEDNKNNITRFAVIGDEISPPSGKDRTSVLLQIPHKPGSLSESLTAFKTNKVNLTWIESFPLWGPESGYLFFLDFEGHARDARIKRTLAELQKNAVRLEVLGSYPRSEPLD
jgi:chorismate mutase/prephenate dehydratase